MLLCPHELYFPPLAWQASLEGAAFACNCPGVASHCFMRKTDGIYSSHDTVVVRAVEAGVSTLTVRVGELALALTLEAAREADVVGMELYRPTEAFEDLALYDDLLKGCERVTEMNLVAGTDDDFVSVVVLADGRRAWGGAGAYRSPTGDVRVAVQANQSCEDISPRTQVWMEPHWFPFTSGDSTTIEGEMGTALVSLPVTVWLAD